MSHSGTAFMSTTLVPTPLPPNPYSPLTHPNFHTAFNACIPLERASTWADLGLSPHLLEPVHVMLQTSPQVAGRTLGYALLHAPNDTARDRVAREIIRCEGDAELLAGLAHVCIFGLIRIFMNLGGPALMEESPRFSFDIDVIDDADEPAEVPVPVPPGTIPKSLTKKLLSRDRYHCAFTSKVDIESLERGDVDLSAEPPRGLGGSYLGVARIVSRPLSSSSSSSGPGAEGVGGMTDAAQRKLHWASSPAAVLDRLAGIDVESILPNLGINHPANAFTTDHAPHVVFARLESWLTPSVDVDGNALADTYDTHMQHPLLTPFIGVLPQVRFRPHTVTTPDGPGVEVPPPSRTLLEIHASCAKVAHLSGAAGVLRDFYAEEDRFYSYEPHQDMSPNPAAAEELVRTLRRAQVG